jgi:hypothetical protein
MTYTRCFLIWYSSCGRHYKNGTWHACLKSYMLQQAHIMFAYIPYLLAADVESWMWTLMSHNVGWEKNAFENVIIRIVCHLIVSFDVSFCIQRRQRWKTVCSSCGGSKHDDLPHASRDMGIWCSSSVLRLDVLAVGEFSWHFMRIIGSHGTEAVSKLDKLYAYTSGTWALGVSWVDYCSWMSALAVGELFMTIHAHCWQPCNKCCNL